MAPSSCVADRSCDGPHHRGSCTVLGIPFPVYICERRAEVCSDMNTPAEWLFRLLFGTFGGNVVIHEVACPPSGIEKLLQ